MAMANMRYRIPPAPVSEVAIADLFGIASLLLGVGALRRQKWAVYGTVCFSAAVALWGVWEFLQGFYRHLYEVASVALCGAVFYAAICFISISYLARKQ